MRRRPATIACVFALLAAAAGARELAAVQPLAQAHAHNDYWHERPLFDALDRGFTSVEADVLLVDGKLLVGHERAELKSGRTLESLYLAPLAERVRANGGRVYPSGGRFLLLVDIKSDAQGTYAALQEALAKHADMLTTVEHGQVRPGAVTVVISGNRPTEALAASEVRHAGWDGRISDLASDVPAHLLPMISDNWTNHFTWIGNGPLPEDERAKLHEIVRRAHGSGRLVRFWATPENEAVWRELQAAGVDLIGTDELDRLAKFLRAEEGAVIRVELPERPPIELKLVAKLGPGPGKENSGIVRSRQFADLFWMHNDSGDEPRIYPVHRNGASYADTRYPDEQGVLIGGAINVDWEDITVDADGQIIVADVGNNENDRRDLVLYYLEEPAPTAGRTTFRKKVFVRYPEQRSFPAGAGEFNFDCEAVFTVGNTVHLLSKNRSNSYTTLYRLDDAQPDVMNVLVPLETFDIRGQAVGADATPDGLRLAVLTYTGVWLFERQTVDACFFGGRISWAPFSVRDAEAICFADDETLLVADESLGELYEVRIGDLTRVR